MSDTHVIRVYRDNKGEWRWYELTSSDITADSGEGYTERDEAVKAAKAHAPEGVKVEIIDP